MLKLPIVRTRCAGPPIEGQIGTTRDSPVELQNQNGVKRSQTYDDAVNLLRGSCRRRTSDPQKHIGSPHQHSSNPQHGGPCQVTEVGVWNEGSGKPCGQGDQAAGETNAKRPRLSFFRKAVTSMRKHHASSNCQDQQRESSHEHHMKEIDTTFRCDRNQPYRRNQQPMCCPDTPGKCRARHRTPPGLRVYKNQG